MSRVKFEGVEDDAVAQEPAPRIKSKERVLGVDVARGFTMVWMIMVDNQGNLSGKGLPAFTETDWNGLSAADTVFPSFLFLLGASCVMAVVGKAERAANHDYPCWAAPGFRGCCSRRRWEEAGNGNLYRRLFGWWEFLFPLEWGSVIARTLRLIIVGVLLNVWDSPEHPIFLGVLLRLGLCYFGVSAMLLISGGSMWAVRMLGICSMVAYVVLYYTVDIPGCGVGQMRPDCNGGRYIDSAVLGPFGTRTDGGTISEGLGSTFTAMVTTCIGAEYGWSLRRDGQLHKKRLLLLYFVLAILCIASGIGLSYLTPLNKKLWTPSFALLVGGISGLHLFFWYLFVDYLGPWITTYSPFQSSSTTKNDNDHLTPFLESLSLQDQPSDPPPRPKNGLQHVAKIGYPLLWLGRNAAVVFVGMVALEILLMVSIPTKTPNESAWTSVFHTTAMSWNSNEASASSVFATYHLILWTAIAGILYYFRIFITF